MFALIGLAPASYPDATFKALLINYIRTSLGRYSSHELMLAFTMAIQGKLSVDMSLYGAQISPAYMERVMGAYETQRGPVIAERLMLSQDNTPSTEQIRELNEKAARELIMLTYDDFIHDRYRTSDSSIHASVKVLEICHDYLNNKYLMHYNSSDMINIELMAVKRWEKAQIDTRWHQEKAPQKEGVRSLIHKVCNNESEDKYMIERYVKVIRYERWMTEMHTSSFTLEGMKKLINR